MPSGEMKAIPQTQRAQGQRERDQRRAGRDNEGGGCCGSERMRVTHGQ